MRFDGAEGAAEEGGYGGAGDFAEYGYRDEGSGGGEASDSLTSVGGACGEEGAKAEKKSVVRGVGRGAGEGERAFVASGKGV